MRITYLAVLLAGCGPDNIFKYCKEAAVLASAFSGATNITADVRRCEVNVRDDLAKLSSSDRAAAETCIACIASTAEEECGCCKTNGELDVVKTACATQCDTSGHRAYCDL